MAKTYQSRPTIQSLDRGLKLLKYIISAEKAVELGELAEFTGIERSSTHRLLATLIADRFVVKDAEKRYLPGTAILELASKIYAKEQIHEMAAIYLNELIEKTGETAHFAVLEGDRVIITNFAASSHVLAVTGRIGESEPIYCTALGKALVCEKGKNRIEQLFKDKKIIKHTKNTISSVDSFIKECALVKAEMIAKDNEEYIVGIRCLAAPVKAYSGDVTAAIGISGPVSRLNDRKFRESSEIVKNVGIKFSKRLGYISRG